MMAGALVAAVMAGLGVAQLPDYAVAAAIARGELKAILPEFTCARGGLWLLRPRLADRSPRADAFTAFLGALLRRAGTDRDKSKPCG